MDEKLGLQRPEEEGKLLDPPPQVTHPRRTQPWSLNMQSRLGILAYHHEQHVARIFALLLSIVMSGSTNLTTHYCSHYVINVLTLFFFYYACSVVSCRTINACIFDCVVHLKMTYAGQNVSLKFCISVKELWQISTTFTFLFTLV